MKSRAPLQFLSMAVVASVLMTGAATAQISTLPDAEIEKCLEQGTITGKNSILIGLTRPVHFRIDCSVDVDSAVFKHLDSHRPGLTRLDGGHLERDFSDSYKYERAAYLLDRHLGLNMVPVVVLRKVKASQGAMVAWIPNAAHESKMGKKRNGQLMAALAPQKAIMRLFDALILNFDRRQENWLVDQDTSKLYLIDHSRSFSISQKLPKEFTGGPARLPQSLYNELKALDEAQITGLIGDLVTDSQIRALLARRDLILEKIDKDCEEMGNAAIFTDWPADQPASGVASSAFGQ